MTTPTTTSLPRNPLVQAMLTDLYQLTMTYAYWKTNRHNDVATFELFFRKNPFGGEYTVCCGLEECLKYLAHFRFAADDIHFLKHHVPNFAHAEDSFWEYLEKIDTSKLDVWALPEGSLAYPRIPLLVVRGPLAVAQLVETALLTLVNYPSLVATNAARMVRAAHAKRPPAAHMSASSGASQFARIPSCVEFGLRRAQGPDGGISASHYAHLGGFAATSNVLAGKLSRVPLSGTHAHAFVQTFATLDEARHLHLSPNAQRRASAALQQTNEVALLPRVLTCRQELAARYDEAFLRTHPGELAAFCAYAAAFPTQFLCLIDTYDTLRSGLLNFVVVAYVLDDLGYTPVGVRLDSGDLAQLSTECANVFARHAAAAARPFFDQLSIVASNDINEESIHALNDAGHAITAYGIGTNLVTCEKQPALGCVYKLVELNGKARIKISQDFGKVLIPGAKCAYRLYDASGTPILDLLTRHDETPPEPGHPVECCHPFDKEKFVVITPSRVEALLRPVFRQGKLVGENVRSLQEARAALARELGELPSDVSRLKDPRAYKVCVSRSLYTFLHDMWVQKS
jgi:nicotinate phosphoribosyltransferase